ncbi:MAG: ATP synthase F1 subunit epsilon [Verrucomicrobia bacterium]|nr:ATP synthase F1 subunit epsilon [Verrucomicrobiota bacterium]
MAEKLKLEIITPTAVTFSEEVDFVTFPAAGGEMGVYPNHTPFMTQVVAGDMIARRGDEEFYLAIGDGFVQITGSQVIVLTDMAIKAKDIDEAEAEKARQKAEARLKEKLTQEEFAAANAELKHSLAKLQVKTRHSGRHRH